MSRVVVASSPTFGRYSDAPVELLRSAGCEVRFIARDDRPALAAALRDASAWITGFEPVGAATLDDAPHIRVVAKCGAGMDNFDHDYLHGRGIAWVNVPGGNSGAVAEYTLGQLIALARGVAANDRSVRNGVWRPVVGQGLDGRTLGVVGFGAIAPGRGPRAGLRHERARHRPGRRRRRAGRHCCRSGAVGRAATSLGRRVPPRPARR